MPVFLHATCVHLEAHFLGFIPLRVIRNPLGELPRLLKPVLRSLMRPGGGSVRQRLEGLRCLISVLLAALRAERRSPINDPLLWVKSSLSSEPERLIALECHIVGEVEDALAAALREVDA